MRENYNKSLESLIGTVTKTKLPGWVKNAVVLFVSVTPLLEILLPLALTGLLLRFLAILLGF
jgi:hypothetical protein